MFIDNWLNIYPIFGMVSLTSGLLLLCSFVRRRPRRDQNFENNSSMSTGRSIHLLTNEDSNKVLRMSLSKSEKRSKGSSDLVEIEQKPRHTMVIIQEEDSITDKGKREIIPEIVVETARVKPKKTKSLDKRKSSEAKVRKSQPDLHAVEESTRIESDENIFSLDSIKSKSNLSVASNVSIRSRIESEPEISTIRTIYRSDKKKSPRSFIDTEDSDEDVHQPKYQAKK